MRWRETCLQRWRVQRKSEKKHESAGGTERSVWIKGCGEIKQLHGSDLFLHCISPSRSRSDRRGTASCSICKTSSSLRATCLSHWLATLPWPSNFIHRASRSAVADNSCLLRAKLALMNSAGTPPWHRVCNAALFCHSCRFAISEWVLFWEPTELSLTSWLTQTVVSSFHQNWKVVFKVLRFDNTETHHTGWKHNNPA